MSPKLARHAGEKKPEAYSLGYVEDFYDPRTKLADIFSSLQVGLHEFAQNTRRIRTRRK